MNPFQYTKARDERTAIGTVAPHPGAAFLAGGTNQLDLMRQYAVEHDHLVDVNALPWREVQAIPQGLCIGAMARMSEVAAAPLVLQNYAAVAEALLASASPQIRNMASIGGNLLQRTRCPYFRDPAFSACNKRRPGSGCSAIPGENRMQAILGTSDACIAMHASDLAVALTALDAVLVLHGPGRGGAHERRVPLVDFYLLPGATPHLENVLQHGELIVAVELPLLPASARSHYLKVRDRSEFEFALASAAVALAVDNGTVRAARVALGGVGTKPWRSPAAEAALIGQPATTATFAVAAKAAVQGAKGYRQNAFKIELVQRTLVRALSTVENRGGTA